MNGSETTQDDTRGVRIPDGRKRAFLKLYRKNGLIAKTAKAIGLSHSGVDYWRAHDPDFAAECERARQEYIEKLEAEADRRAMGWDEPILDRDGRETGQTRFKYSDLMMIFRLKGLAPEKYAERRQVDQRVSVQVSPFQELKPSERARELERLQAIMAEVAAPPLAGAEKALPVVETVAQSED